MKKLSLTFLQYHMEVEDSIYSVFCSMMVKESLHYADLTFCSNTQRNSTNWRVIWFDLFDAWCFLLEDSLHTGLIRLCCVSKRFDSRPLMNRSVIFEDKNADQSALRPLSYTCYIFVLERSHAHWVSRLSWKQDIKVEMSNKAVPFCHEYVPPSCLLDVIMWLWL